ncbi:hypothetical protein EVAR_29384_1 [Eumeta japonica]|uniref:Uncharacterized protein n=1 Tax=Eumeta variegata TaxID=151549 RepID=A0A4C1YB01_EUMVA|nr:hypothetical protein EVAR_29384_1 [Eumeta japonica]
MVFEGPGSEVGSTVEGRLKRSLPLRRQSNVQKAIYYIILDRLIIHVGHGLKPNFVGHNPTTISSQFFCRQKEEVEKRSAAPFPGRFFQQRLIGDVGAPRPLRRRVARSINQPLIVLFVTAGLSCLLIKGADTLWLLSLCVPRREYTFGCCEFDG